MQRDDFAVFILSHGRADKQITLSALLDQGYTGSWFIVVDNLDEDANKYLSNYRGHVIIFDKPMEASQIDSMTNSGELRSVLFARHACYQIAQNMGLHYFAEFDDDLSNFCYKWDESGVLKSVKVRNMDGVFNAILAYMDDVPYIAACNIPAQGAYFGGRLPDPKWNLNQSFILRASTPYIPFCGILNEDENGLLLGAKSGMVAIEQYSVCKTDKKRGSNSGGLRDLYDDSGEYIRAFYTVMCAPYCAKIKIKKNGEIIVTTLAANAFPKIISDRWRKYA